MVIEFEDAPTKRKNVAASQPIEFEDAPDVATAPAIEFEDAPERPYESNPIRQIGAAILGLPADLTSVAGLAGRAGEAGYNTLLGDKGFMENWEEAGKEGFDKTLLEMGGRGRENINKFFDIGEPVSTTDQIARMLGSFLVPVPAGFLGGAAATGLKGLAGKAATLVSPAVRMGPKGERLNKAFKIRAGTSLGVGTGLDQGIRALEDRSDRPLLFSKQALQGHLDPVPPAPIEFGDAPAPIEFEDADVAVSRLEEQDAQAERAQGYETLKTVLFILAGLGGSYAAVRAIRKSSLDRLKSNAPEGLSPAKTGPVEDTINLAKENPLQIPGILHNAASPAARHVLERATDKTLALQHQLRDMGFTDSEIAQQLSNIRADSKGMADSVAATGRFPKDTNISTFSLDEMDLDFIALSKLGPQHQKIFNDAMLAADELNILRNNLTAEPSLWRKGISDQELIRRANLGRKTDGVKELMDKSNHFMNSHLKYAKELDLIDEAGFQRFSREFANPNGTNGHVPFADINTGSIYKDIKKFFGIHTSTGQQADVIGQYIGRGALVTRGVEAKPMAPLAAMRQYNKAHISGILEQSAQAKALESLSGTSFDPFTGLGGGTKMIRVPLDADGKVTAYDPSVSAPQAVNGRQTRYIGKGTVAEGTDAVEIKLVTDDPKITGRFDRSGKGKYSTHDLKAMGGDEVVIVQQRGELRAYHVPDASTRAMLDMNPQMSSRLLFMNHYKRLFTRLTVGDLSIFGPFSHAFSAQQIAWNTFSRKGAIEGFKSIPRGLRGTWQLLKTNSAKETSDYLAKKIARDSGMAAVAPRQTKALQARLQQIYERSLSNDIRRESGRMRTGLQSETFTGSMEQFNSVLGPSFAKAFGADEMGFATKLWKSWNNAIQEGPAFAVASKHMGQSLIDNGGAPLTVRQIQAAVEAGQSLAGDMSRMGASEIARVFNATSPFSASMVQSWNTLGAAAKYNPGRFLLGAASLIGAPTVSEMLYTSTLSDMMADENGKPLTFVMPGDPTRKEWTYNDYYWNGYTTQQRADNFIIMVPGKPPWEAIVIPVSPEWGLFRGAVMESLDAVIQLSQVGDMATANNNQAELSRHQLRAGLFRAFDIPLNPLIVAGFSSLGIDMRFGFNINKSEDADDPGDILSFGRLQPFGGGQRVTRREGTKNVDDDFTAIATNIITDIFGAAGSLYVAVHEAFAAGLDTGEDAGIMQAARMAMDAFGNGLRKQARYLQPIAGKAMSPNNSGEIETSLFSMKKNLDAINRDANNLIGLGRVSGTTGRDNMGNSVKLPNDALYKHVALQAKHLKASIAPIDKDISALRYKRSILPNSTDQGSRSEVRDKMDIMTLEIQKLQAIQRGQLMRFQRQMSEALSSRENFNRKIDINLETITPRPNPSGPASRSRR